jgi:UDPglucose 6-dehydrogenase
MISGLISLDINSVGDFMINKTIKIYGRGYVGKAMLTLFPDALVHDPEQGLISTEDVDVAFVCVPTPLKDGRLDVSIVENLIKETNDKLYVIRSTVMPGTCDYLTAQGKQVVFQPEFLGETVNHPMSDQKSRQWLILGGTEANRRKVIELYQQVYNANISIRQMSAYEAEVCKLTENRAIAFKVAQCQELYDACEKNGVDYYTIRDAVYGDDPRFNMWFTFIYPNKRGFNSKCLPKDVYGWSEWAGKPTLTETLLKYNDKLINHNPFI